MGSIGSESFIRLDWNRHQLGMMHRRVTRPGTRGTAHQEIGEKARATQARTVKDFDTDALMEAAYDAYVAMKGTIVTVTTDLGIAIDNVFIEDVVVVDEAKLINASGGTTDGNYLQTLAWTFQEV